MAHRHPQLRERVLLDLQPAARVADEEEVELSQVKSVTQTIAQGLIHPLKGRVLRESLRVFLSDVEKVTDEPVRAQCARIVGEALTLAHGVGTGDLCPKSAREHLDLL